MAFDLPPLPAGLQIVDEHGRPTMPFQVYWQQILEAIVTQVVDLTQIQADLAAAIADILAAQAAADLALLNAQADMPELAPIMFTANYLGVIDPAAQLPREIQAVRLQAGVDVTTSAAWSIVAESEAVTATIGAADGIIEITAVVGSDNLTVTSDYMGVERTRILVVSYSVAGAPDPGAGGGGGGGTTATDSSFASFNSPLMATVSDELTAIVGSAGEVQLSAILNVTTDNIAPNGYHEVFGIWQWYDTGGAVWTDLGTEVASNPDARRQSGPGVTAGGLNVNHLKTGLTPAASEKFRLQARNIAPSTRVMYLTGTASAVGQ